MEWRTVLKYYLELRYYLIAIEINGLESLGGSLPRPEGEPSPRRPADADYQEQTQERGNSFGIQLNYCRTWFEQKVETMPILPELSDSD
jgi:hypothetical protein